MGEEGQQPATQPEIDSERNERLLHEEAVKAMAAGPNDGEGAGGTPEDLADNKSVDDHDEPQPILKKPSAKTQKNATPKEDPQTPKKPKAKSKAKATAKSKASPKAATAKAKGKGKATGKGKKGGEGKGKGKEKKGVPTLKRPAASVGKENKDKEDEEPVLKKPAAKVPKKIADQFTVDLAEDEVHAEDLAGEEMGEEEDPVEDDEVEPPEDDPADSARDRSKSKKFFGMLKRGSLPEAAKEAWGKCANRKEMTAMINTLFKSDGKHLVIQERFALPKSYMMEKEMAKKEKAREQQEGYGKTIFMRKNQLTEEDLQACMDSGEVVSWRSGGLTLYAATNQTFSQEASKISKEKMASDVINLDANTGRAFAACFDMMQPEVQGPAVRGAQAIGNKSSASGIKKPPAPMLLRWHLKNYVLAFSCGFCSCCFIYVHVHSISLFTYICSCCDRAHR